MTNSASIIVLDLKITYLQFGNLTRLRSRPSKAIDLPAPHHVDPGDHIRIQHELSAGQRLSVAAALPCPFHVHDLRA